MPRRNPARNRRPPLRLVVQIDENDQLVRYEERRVVVHALLSRDEAEEESAHESSGREEERACEEEEECEEECE